MLIILHSLIKSNVPIVPHKVSFRNKGQVIPYFLVLIFVLIICWAMMINMAKLLKDRMMMQSAADNAALSVAVYKARVLNTLGLLNYAIGNYLYGTESGFESYYEYGVTFSINNIPFPLPVMCFPMGGYSEEDAVDDQKKVACYMDMLHHQSGGAMYIGAIRKYVDGMVNLQDFLLTQYYANAYALAQTIGRRQERNSAGTDTGADYVVINTGVALDLKRNENGVEYHRTGMNDSLLEQLAKFLVNGVITFINPAKPVNITIRDVYKAHDWNRGQKSWLYADKNAFGNHHKIVLLAFKNSQSTSNKGYPLLGSWIGITWPDMITTAAAGIYNTEGPMFPLERNSRPSDKISPVIREYRKAEHHGWDAHVVPIGAGYQH